MSLPGYVVIGLFVLAGVLLVIGMCRASAGSDAATEADMAQREASQAVLDSIGASSDVQRSEVPTAHRAAIQRSLEAGRSIRAAAPGVRTGRGPWIGHDQEGPARRARLQATQRPRRRVRRRVKVENRVDLISEGQILDSRPTLEAAVARAREIFADPSSRAEVIYFWDTSKGGARGWLNRKDKDVA
jgi:hypothetical protein